MVRPGVEDLVLGSRSSLATNSIFLRFLFVKRSLICLKGKLMTPGRGKHFSLPFLPATPLSRTLEGLFELTLRPSRALNSPCVLLPELQRNKDTKNLIVRSLKTHLTILDCENSVE